MLKANQGPYSKFRVGATILVDDGTFISGANVENASYPVGTCAERCAGVKAVVSFYTYFPHLEWLSIPFFRRCEEGLWI